MRGDKPAAAPRDRLIDLPTSIIGSLLVLLLAGLQVINPPVVEAFRLRIFDELQALHPAPPQLEAGVVIVDIDDESLAQVGQWPWPRSTFAALLDGLHTLGARVVGMDVLFAEADRYSPPVYARSLAALAPEIAAALQALPDNDAAMARAMRRQAVVLGVAGIGRVSPDFPGISDAASRVATLGRDPRQFLSGFPGLVGVVPALAEAASGFGLVSVSPDVDGIVRRVPLIASAGGHILPGLALETLRLALGETTLIVRSSGTGVEQVSLRGVGIPVDAQGRAWVRFGLRQPDRYVSAADVLAGTVPRQRLSGRIVLIGTSAAGLGDIKQAPLVGTTPGVEIHASLLETLLAGTVLQRPQHIVQLEPVILLVLGLALAWLGPMVRASFLPALLGLVVAAGLYATWYMFRYHELLVDATYIAGGLGVLLFWLAMARYVREESRRRTIRNAFSRYLSPVMVDKLASGAGALKLGGERRELTVLFSDIRSFTGLAERYESNPEGLTQLLNRYFTAMTTVILDHSGTIDKYIGDAIMAFWNAPLPVQGHPRQACLSALGMRKELRALNEALHADPDQPDLTIRIGVGINTGECFVGNMGSDLRFNYSVIGDPVNVASRVETRSKSYGVDIVIGESTRQAAADLALLELDQVQLVGKSATTRLYALLGDAACARSDGFRLLERAHDAMLVAYRAQHWDEAEQGLQRCRALGSEYGLDRLYEGYAARIVRFRQDPPPPDWDGSEIATSKD
jgi:adenylate cyclase